ncbi:MAG: TonB-dependent receptor [Pseudomonadota bacterium]
MIFEEFRAILARVMRLGLISLLGLMMASNAMAQENDDDDAEDTATEEEERVTDEVVVTGSRLKRDTYSSIAPLQIITGQVSREVGLIDASDILQESTASSGQQIDLTFQGFVLDNGPASSTINLRGLGEARTLTLINGRRLAPSGVEGAPFAANLNLVPASLVQQYDLLLDGASSVYGSDAIAGVANIILRKDFDGLEIEAFSNVPDHPNGMSNTLSAVYGMNFDRGFFGVGVEYVDNERVALRDRPWTAGCNKHYEIDENGNFRTEERFYNNVYGMTWDECRLGSLASRVSVPVAGSIYYTPGVSNGGWGNFSESSTFGFGIDSNGDGVADLSFRDYDNNGKPSELNSDLFPASETQNYMAFGEYTFDGEANITPYAEVLHSRIEFFSDSGEGQFFPNVPALNPFNLCNPAAPGGVDCGLAQDALYTNPGYIANFANNFADLCASFGIPPAGCTPATFGLLSGPIGAADTLPIVRVDGDRNTTDVEGEQTRVVLGVRGDLPGLSNLGSLDNWTFDVYGSFSHSVSDSSRAGIRGDRTDLALGVFSTTNTPCENDTGEILAADVAPGCVPVNMFAPSLYPFGDNVVGDFATQAERDYLFDTRDFYTKYSQTVFSAFATGDLFEMQGGSAAMVIGIETRNDDIESIPDDVARNGLFFGFFSDGGALGDKDTDEFFAEVELPLLAGKPGFQELTVNLSTRLTDDEIYGDNWTESYKLAWRPTNSLLLRGTYGTAFRAPNLRELYLQNQSGFGNIFDPCLIPDAALDPISGGYNPALDDREPQVLANCLANGVDPTIASNNGFNTLSTEVASGGSLTLDPEQSESWSAGFSWEQPFTNAFNLAISSTYYEIEVRDTIIEPSGQFVVNDCYFDDQGTSIFCDRINRDLSDPTFPRINLIDAGFLNRDQEKARGVDVNIAFDDTFTIFDRPVDFGMDLTGNRQLERSTLFTTDNGGVSFNEFQGEFGFPEWRANGLFRFDYDKWRLTYELRYTGSVHQDRAGIDAFDQAVSGASDTCDGPPSDVLCRDYGNADNYFLQNMSVYYFGDRWTFGGGIRNIEDQRPPIVDGTEILSVNNTPIGYGYNIGGRTFFFNASFSFLGGQ